ncbi:hypothetical protein WJX79_008379 [Trebouxia sp. C0005]
MKSLLGLKAKAQTVIQEQFDRSSAQQRQRPQFGIQPGQDQSEANSGGALDSRALSSESAGSHAEKKAAVDPIIQQLLKNARSEAVRQEFLSMPQGEYTSKHSIEVLVGTYNVNGRRPPADLDLRPWLDMSSHTADIVAVGFQEVVPLNAGNVVMGGGLEAGSVWDMHIDRALNNPVSSPMKPGSAGSAGTVEQSPASSGKLIPEDSTDWEEEDDGNAADEKSTSASADVAGRTPSAAVPSGQDAANVFVQVAAKQMVGVYLSLWVRRGVLPHMRGVQVTSVGTGMMGYLGNKGAVAARLRVYDSGICFICSHLSSGENEGDELKRNYDYSEIVRRGQFPPDSAVLDPETSISASPGADSTCQASGDGRGPGQWGSQRGLLENEHAIWMGDLNYRLTISDDKARNLIKDSRLDKLVEADELIRMVHDGRSFAGWTEGHISFPPTFKFKRGTSQYLGMDDEDESDQTEHAGSPDKAQKEKKRTPAWTDRVLYKSPSGAAKQKHYSSANLLVSDHKPVSSMLTLTVREYVRDAVEAAVDTARRTVDAREMAAMPRCELEPTSAEVGEAFYGQEKKMHLILRNTGLVTANFQFMPLPGAMFGDDKDKNFRTAPRWATIEPEQGVIEPGSGQEVLMTIWINGGIKGTAQLAAAKPDCKLEAILVLRIQDGNDIFVSVGGKYHPSFFGVTLQRLSTLPRPLVPVTSDMTQHDSGLRISTARSSEAIDKSAEEEQPGSAVFYSPSASQDASPASTAHHSPDHSDAHTHLSRHQSATPSATDATPRQQPASAQPDDPVHLTAQQAQPHDSMHESAVATHVPPELRAITAYLRDKGRLRTPGLFVNSADAAMLWAMHQPAEVGTPDNNREPKSGCALAVRQVREALDRGQEVPASTSAHDVAATLLAFFASLPTPFMPPAAAQVCDVCVPSASAASSLLADSLSPVEWAVFRHISELLQEALAQDNSAANGLTSAGLAALFAESWFPGLTPGYGAAGQNLKPEDVAELQRMAENVGLIADRRAAFVALFLDPDESPL